MVTFLTILLIFIAIILGFMILLQQGKGEIGLGGGGNRGSQLIFGGSSGENFFEKLTWILGAIFIGGCILLTIYRSKYTSRSVLQGRYIAKTAPAKQQTPKK
ncbi:preprotein translocase subunit SecG [Candidatus Babeliales bacterium]|nr:preprotein translocase subunit SecG [Candidatus Babeliales bacterium]